MLRPVFQDRPRKEPTPAPEGFDITLSTITQDEAYAVITARLKDARSRLPPGFDGRVIAHAYADGSVDGELYVTVPEDVDTRTAEFDMYDAFLPLAVGVKYWVSTGARYQVEADDERYKRNRGMTQVQTNYQRAIRPNIVEVHTLMRHKIIKGMDRTFGEEAKHVFIRLHWNPENEQPKR